MADDTRQEAGPSTRDQYFPRRESELEGAGKSALGVTVAAKDGNHRYVYITPSIREILGYEPEEMVGKNHMSFYHPEEIPFIYPAYMRLQQDQTMALVSYHRERHKKGYWVDICVQGAVVYDHWVGIISRQPRNSTATLNPARDLICSAVDVIEANMNMSRSGLSVSKWHMDPNTGPRLESTNRFQRPDPAISPLSSDEDRDPITEDALLRVLSDSGLSPDLGPDAARELRPRTAFFIDRFTQACTVEYVSNSLVVNALHKLLDKPFFCIVRPSDRALVRTYIEHAKEAGPVVKDEKKPGGHGFCRFSVLKIPDFPPLDEVFPQSTDEDERSMPGQEFIPVEAVFTAGSDGVLCVIERLPKEQR